MIRCHEDSNKEVLDNTIMIMQAIVDRLAWSLDYKTADMALRHETHIVKNVTNQGCSHNVPDKTQLRYAPSIHLGQFEWESGSAGAVTVGHLQSRIDACFKTDTSTAASPAPQAHAQMRTQVHVHTPAPDAVSRNGVGACNSGPVVEIHEASQLVH